MNGFRKMQETLSREGWFVAWNLHCCQTCAWSELAWIEHLVEDSSKVLFNHSQDCVVEGSEEECGECGGDGFTVDDDEDCSYCNGTGYEDFRDADPEKYDTSIGGFVCNYPEMQEGSCFCFDGSKEGLDNFKAVIPLIEESGCKVSWNGSCDQRPYISWNRG